MNKRLKVILQVAIFLFSILSFDVHAKKLLVDEYTTHVKAYFAEEQWDEGKRVLDEGINKYPGASNLQWLMGRYWFHKKDYSKSRYHLIKAIELNYNNVEAKHLLVDVEDITKNYSSAICYVNELLEVNPYWQGLWRRKIELYRKQGNDVEANRLLKRINQIYPNDSLLHKDYVYSVEVQYQKLKKNGDRKKAIKSLEELLQTTLTNEEYYLDIISLYLLEGDAEKALLWSSLGLSNLPQSELLIYKKSGILSEMGRHADALLFVQEQRRRNGNSAGITRLYNSILLDAARASKQNDTYTLYGMAYQNGDRSKDVLDNLLSIALQRGYNDDALLYLRESKRRYGMTKSVLYSEYLLYCKMNEETKSFNVLDKLCKQYPNDLELVQMMCLRQLQRSGQLMEQNQYAEALVCASYVTLNDVEKEISRSAWNRVLACRIQLKQYNDALMTLDTISVEFDYDKDIVSKRAYILNSLGRTKEALALYLKEIEKSDIDRPYYIAGYTDIAIPFIKRCMEMGATKDALNESEQLLFLNPNEEQALRYAVNAAGQLDDSVLFRGYTEKGLHYYPGEPFFIVKKASVHDVERRYDKSIELLCPVLRQYPGNVELSKALSQSSEFFALDLIRNGQPNKAIAILDTALMYDAQSKTLLYTKGLAYEKLKMYDKAYTYQKHYLSSNVEDLILARQLKGLQRTMMNDQVGFHYLQSRYGETDAITSVATAEYTHKSSNNIYTGRINYVGRSGTSDEEIAAGVKDIESGGVGLQLQAEWTHKFTSDWQTMINAAWSSRYFPKIMANASISKFLNNDWELEVRGGYRRLDDRNLFSLGPAVSKTLGAVWLNTKADLFVMNSQLYYNALLQARVFPFNDRVSYISAMVGAGTAPELSVLDRALPGSFAHINSMVGLGGNYMLTQNLSIGVLGTWHTYYMEQLINNKDLIMRYKNIYNIYVQVYISF